MCVVYYPSTKDSKKYQSENNEVANFCHNAN